MTDRSDEVVYLNTCELVIQSLSLKSRGVFYLVWKKGKKNTQSNKYTLSSDEIIHPKQQLSLSLKIYYHNGNPLPRHTHLILFNNAGEEIQRKKILIHQWAGEYHEEHLEIAGGIVKIRGRRKGVMKLEKFHKLRADVEETSEDESARFLKKNSNKLGNSDKDEILRLTKETEDLNFLVDKLKQERNSGLVRIQRLQTQLSQVNDKMSKDLFKVRQYYTKKIELRQSIFKQEIQQLVTSFNKNYECNYTMMQNLINEKFDYQDEIRELKESNQQFISRQSQNFENLISQMQKHKLAVDDELKDSNEKLNEREATIVQLNDEIDRLNEELQQLRNAYKQLQDSKHEQEQKLAGQIHDLNIKITQNESLIHEQTLMIERLTSQNTVKDDQINSLSNLVSDHVKDKNDLHTQNMKLIDAREELIHNNQILTIKNSQLENQLKQMHGEVDKMRIQYEELTNKYRIDLDERHQTFRKEVQAERDQNIQLNHRLQELFHQKQMTLLKNAEQESLIIQQNDEIDIYKKQLDQSKQLAEQLTKEMTQNVQRFKETQHDLNQRLTQYINRASQLQTENMQLHTEIREAGINFQEELIRMKDQYEVVADSNNKLHEDEIEMLKKAKEDEEEYTQSLKTQYQNEINATIEAHKNQLEELEKVYKEDSDRKDSELYQMLQEKNNLMEEFQAFKFKVEMDEANREQQMKSRPKKGLSRNRKMSQIEELQDEELQQIDSSEESSPVIPVRKKKKKTKVLKIEELSQEEPSEPSEQKFLQQEQFQEEEDSESVFELLKQKKNKQPSPKKGRLKLNKAANVPSNLSQSVQTEQQENVIPQENESSSVQEEQQDIRVTPKSKMLKRRPRPIDVQQVPQKKLSKVPKGPNLDSLLLEKGQLQERVAQLEAQIQTMQLNQKSFKAKVERDEKKYLNRIKGLQNQIEDLNKQIEQLFLKLNEQDSKAAAKFKAQAQEKHKELSALAEKQKKQEEEEQKRITAKEDALKQKIQREPPSPKSTTSKKSKQSRKMAQNFEQHDDLSPKSQQLALKRPPTKQLYDQEKLKKKIEALQQMLMDKQRKIQIIQAQNETLLKEKRISDQNGQRANMLESKVLDKNRVHLPLASFGGQTYMKQSIAQLEDKITNQKERYGQLKIKYEQKSRQNEEMNYEMKKLKTAMIEMESQEKRRTIPRSLQDMQTEIEDANRKILQLSRQINQARLERDSFEDQMRLVRKKLVQVTKSNQENEARCSQNERQLDDFRRKEQKYKRQIQEYQEDVKRLKEVNRNNIQELSQVRKSQSQFIIQRKKVLDQTVRLQGVIAQKQTQLIKLNKQMEKLRGKINETSEGKLGRQRQYRTEMEKLEIQRSKMERKNRELQETIKMLKEKLDSLEKEARKLAEQRKQTYGEKLKNYISQIVSIKQVVEQYQQENTQLKHQNSQFFDQNEMLKASFEKLQIKYEQQSQYIAKLQEDLEILREKIAEAQSIINAKAAEDDKSKMLITSLRKQLDSERTMSRRKTQKVQQLQQINERCLYDIKNLRLKLNDYETNTEDNQKLAQQLFASQRTIGSLEQQLNKISQEYQMHTVKYVYTLQDVQTAIRQMKDHQDKVKEEEMTKIINQLDQSNSDTRKNMERELLALYEENQKLRVNLHKANQNNLEIQLEMAEFGHLKEQYKRNQKDKTSLDRRVIELNDELKSSKDEIRRLQIKFNESIRNQENKSTQNLTLQQKYDDLSKRYEVLNQTHLELKADDQKLLEKYKSVNDEKDQTIEKLTNQIQTMHNKLLANELEINRLKEIDAMNGEDYFKNKKKLQNKIEQINDSYRIKERQAEVHFKNQIRELKTKVTKLEQHLQQRQRRNEQLQEGIFMLQSEVQELTSQLTEARSQLAEEGQMYTLEINKLRNEMSQNQLAYDNNLRSLQEELSMMSKELTTLKYARQNQTNSRLRLSRQSQNVDQRGNRRYQEKIKLKDRRIQELKETIIAYEQKITQLGKKDSVSAQVEYWKAKYTQAQLDWKLSLGKKTAELTQINEENKLLNEKLSKYKITIEELTLKLEEKDLQLTSLRSQLSMLSKLYNDLQKEIDKRKQKLNQQLESDSDAKLMIERLKKQIGFKEEQITEISMRLNQTEITLKKKNSQLKVHLEKIQSLEKEKKNLLELQKQLKEEDFLKKLRTKEVQTENQSLKTQNFRLANENSLATRQIQNLRAELTQKNITVGQILKEVYEH